MKMMHPMAMSLTSRCKPLSRFMGVCSPYRNLTGYRELRLPPSPPLIHRAKTAAIPTPPAACARRPRAGSPASRTRSAADTSK